MKFLKLIIIAFIIAGPACKKNAVEVDHNLFGEWESVDQGSYVYIRITRGNFSMYDSPTEHHSGEATIKRKKHEMYISKKVIVINRYPYEITDSTGQKFWRVKLDNMEFEKY